MKNLTLTISLCVLFTSAAVLAFPTQVIHENGPQDPLFVPTNVHELGTAPGFDPYPDELIYAIDSPTNETVCFDPLTPDDLAVPNTLVEMRNLTGIAWNEVWYVANPETTHSNYDGRVADFASASAGILGTAFRIDDKLNNPGIHNPLVFESLTPDGIFEPFETWRFVIQDYSNALGLPASALGSIGVPSTAIPGAFESTGSIIATPVPEPATMVLLGVGGLLFRKNRKV